MAEDTPVSFGMGDAQRIDRSVTHYERTILGGRTPAKQRTSVAGEAITIGRLSSAITASTDGLLSPTLFTFYPWIPGEEGGEWEESEDQETGYHRDSRTGEIGAIVHCAKVGPEWHAINIEPVCQSS